jgi:hypothetical protein
MPERKPSRFLTIEQLGQRWNRIAAGSDAIFSHRFSDSSV